MPPLLNWWENPSAFDNACRRNNMSLSLFRTSGRAKERGQIYCTLPCRLVTHVSAQVALQRCPILCMSSWIISLAQVGSFSKLKWAHFQYYFSVILGPSGCIFEVKVGSFSMLKNSTRKYAKRRRGSSRAKQGNLYR